MVRKWLMIRSSNLFLQLVEKVAAKATIRSTPGIERCSVLDGIKASDPPRLQVEGFNFEGLAKVGYEILDFTKMKSNHIYAIMELLGVEAARATIVEEVKKVFGMYGIKVDQRHLSLIADYMTLEGGYRACNRLGIRSNCSPLQKMSFETAMQFLTDATLQGQKDRLESPSARIVMGRIVELGTGCFDLYQNLNIG